MNRHFQPNMQNVKTTAGIPTKSCTVIKTSKNSSCMVPQCPPQIQDGGRPSSSKHDKLLYLSNRLTDFDEILHSDILGLQFISAIKIFKFFKTQYSGWPQFDKSSAVAKMGDCGHNIHGPKRGVPLCIFCRSWDPV